LQTHVTDVRNTFLRALAQPELSVEETLALEEHTPDDLKPEVRGQTNRQRPGRKTNAGDNHPEQALQARVIKSSQATREQNSDAPEATRH